MTSAKAERFPRQRFLALATAILLLAALLRLIALHDLPPGLSQDEVLNADIVEFIRGGRHALFFREGYGHEPLYHYWAVPFQVLLGDNVLSIRLPAVTLGLLLLALTLRWARRDYGAVPALVAGAGLAVSWWPIIFSRIGLRPILEPALLVAAAWFWRRRPWLAGLLLGAAAYSYTAARYLFLLPAALLLYLLLRGLLPGAAASEEAPPTFAGPRRALLIFLLAFACYLPLALTLRADPSLQQRVEQLAGPLAALRRGDLGPVWETTRATLGVFAFGGDPRWTYTLPGRPLFDPLSALFFYGGLLLALWRWREARYAFLLLWLALTLLPSAVTPQAPSTIRLIGALPVVYLLPGLALGWLWQRRAAWPALRGPALAALLGLLLLLNLGRTLRDGFGRWPAAQETHLKYQSVYLEMARHWQRTADAPPVVADAYFEPIDADTFRRNLGPLEANARWVQGVNALVYPGGANGTLYTPEYAPPAGALLAAASVPAEPAYRSDGDPAFATYPLPADAVRVPPLAEAVTFGERLTLLGYTDTVTAGGVQLLTWWRVEAPLPADLALFLHLTTAEGAIAGQWDGLDAIPATLRPGDTFLQLHTIPRPAQQGPFALALGAYTRADGQRLISAGSGGDRLILLSSVRFDEREERR